MRHIRFVAATIAGLFLSALALVAAAPASFAMRVVEPQGVGSATATTVVKSQGMAGWEIVLIVVAAAAVVVALAFLLMRVRFRPALRPAAR